MAKSITQLTVAASVADADIIPVVQGGVTKQATALMMRVINFLSSAVQIGERQGVNFIAGTSTSIAMVDNPGSNRVDITIGSTATPNNDPATKVFKNQTFQ